MEQMATLAWTGWQLCAGTGGNFTWNTHLRRLAAQGHDHECEIQFLTGEIIARRGTMDTWSRPRFWAGLLYEVLSDFGRSVVLPVLWLAVSIWVFAGIYGSHNPELALVPYGQEAPCTSAPAACGPPRGCFRSTMHFRLPASARPETSSEPTPACMECTRKTRPNRSRCCRLLHRTSLHPWRFSVRFSSCSRRTNISARPRDPQLVSHQVTSSDNAMHARNNARLRYPGRSH